MSNALVTGAGGLVGRALCAKMRADGWQVRGTVRSAKPPTSLPNGVEPLVVESIGPKTDWSKASAAVDTIVHLAARVHVMNDTAADPLTEFRKVNVEGTESLAREAAKSGVRRLIYVSSVKVNGEGGQKPYCETDKPCPLDPYGQSKLEAEEVLKKVAAETGLEVVILRPPLIYGPGVRANFLRLLNWVERGIPLPLGSVYNQRNMIYLGNFVDCIMTCLQHPKAGGQTFLVSDGEDVSTSNLIRVMAEAMGKKARIFPFPQRLLNMLGKITGKTGEIERLTGSLCVDSSKIKETLGWQPPFSLADGIRETVRWYMAQR